MDSTAPRTSWGTPLKLALAVIGVAAVGWLVSRAGVDEIARAMARAAPWLPVLVAIEAARIALEIAAVQRLYDLLARTPDPAKKLSGPAPVGRARLSTPASVGPEPRPNAGSGDSRPRTDRSAWSAGPVPRAANVRAHLAAYAIAAVAPGGRGAAEAAKAALLAPYAGGAAAAAAGATNQALVLLGNAVVAALVFGFAVAGGVPLLAASLLVYAMAMAGLYGAIVWIGRRADVPRPLARFRGVVDAAARFRHAMERLPAFPAVPAALTTVGRLLQPLKYAIALYAIAGAPPLALVLAAGAALVGAAVGDPIPAQLGATEGALALWADSLGVTVADAVAAGLLVHAIQLGWVIVGVLTPLLWPVAPMAPAE